MNVCRSPNFSPDVFTPDFTPCRRGIADEGITVCGSGYAEESMLIQEEGSATRSATSFMAVVVAAGVALVLGA
jgi:hypothetical protein